jgi:hypothetical protein
MRLIMDNFEKKQLISEAHTKVKRLKETRRNFGFIGAFTVGCLVVGSDGWSVGFVVGGFFFWFCIYAYYQLGLHTDSINKKIEEYEKHGDEKEGDYLSLQYSIECNMIDILTP